MEKEQIILSYIFRKAADEWMEYSKIFQGTAYHVGKAPVIKELLSSLADRGYLESKMFRPRVHMVKYYRLTEKAIEDFKLDAIVDYFDGIPRSEQGDEKEGYLYIMYETKAKTIKIGKSKNTPQREQSLNSTKMPMRVYLVAQVRSPYWVEAEDILHNLYEDYCVDPYETSKRKTEWFDLNPIEMACCMLLTPFHLEEMVVNGKIPKRSLTELVEGARETFLNPTVPYTDFLSARREYTISQLYQVIRDKSSLVQRYEDEITNLKLKQELGEEYQQGSPNRIRSALRALPTNYENGSLLTSEDNVTTENSENIVNN